jgi:multidrug efflux pump subunit AcrA (membrane-fusion protein)
MAEETTQAQEAEGQQEATTQAVDAGQTEAFDLTAAKKLRSENASLRSRLKELEGKTTAYEQERMTETQRWQAQALAAQAAAEAAGVELRKTRADAALAAAAAKHGVDAGLLSKLVTLEFDDTGAPINIDASVAEVLKVWPQLKAAVPNVTATNPGRTQRLSMDDIKRMSPDEINRRWAEVSAVLGT